MELLLFQLHSLRLLKQKYLLESVRKLIQQILHLWVLQVLGKGFGLAARRERQAARDKIAAEVANCEAGFQTMIGNARNLNRTGAKGAKTIMAGRHVPKGLPHISNRENV